MMQIVGVGGGVEFAALVVDFEAKLHMSIQV